LRHFKKEIEERNNFNPVFDKGNNVPYLVDQHLLNKKDA
jgi:NADH-quinone oxidoreductase subunit F